MLIGTIIFTLLLTAIESFADVKIEISNIKGKSYKAKFETQEKADAWIADNIANNSWGKKERWEKYTDQTNCLEIVDVTREVDDISIPYPEPVPVLDANGDPVLDERGFPTYEPYTHPQVTIVEYQNCKLPVEYTIVSCNDELTYNEGDACKAITDEMKAIKSKEVADKLREDELKAKDKAMKLEELIELMQLKGLI